MWWSVEEDRPERWRQLRQNEWASEFCCWKEKGTYTLGPLVLNGRQLTLNARVYKELDIELLGEGDQPIRGFAANIRMADDLRIPVKWADGEMKDLVNKPVKIRFRLYDAEVFAMTCE